MDASTAAARARTLARELPQTLRAWPWFDTLRTLRARFREDRLGLTAGSLTFTTLISLVPLVTVMLAVFTAFPMFAGFEKALQEYFLQNLVPDNIARPVLRSLTQFAAKARGMGTAGLVFLVITALALVLTIDRTLNAIWRVRQPRPLGQRVLVYWAAITLGPLAMGLSLTATSLAVGATRGWAQQALPGGFALLLDTVQFLLLAGAASGLYHYVPNTAVRWRHALAGGLFVAIAFEVAKKLLALYLDSVPVVNAVYGAFAVVPILLLWVYLVWVIVLLGAVIAAYAPSLQMRVAQRPAVPGWRFELALAVLKLLDTARAGGARGLSLAQLSERLRADPLQIEPTLELLATLDWVQPLDEGGEPRHVLLADPAATPLAPLLERTLLQPGPASQALVARSGWQHLLLADVLG
jgi:membrane protein